MPSGRPIDEHRLGRHAGILEDDRDEPFALERRTPPGPPELAVLEVAQRVRGEQPVGLEELPQDGAVDCRLDRERAARPTAGDRDARHQASSSAGPNGGVRRPAAVSQS